MNRKLSRSFDELKEIVALTDVFFKEHKINADVRHTVDLCIEELFVNMVTYDTETDADILLEMTPHGKGIQVSLTDFGVHRFDPRDAPAVDINAPLDERTPGGLGLYLVVKMVDSIHYEYQDKTSKITFVVNGK
ncbi:MAG: ATP-binding protein [Gammaproteobacteria bacterium]|nr:ATP-binding protein [Gammaproteobacteria bacterium]